MGVISVLMQASSIDLCTVSAAYNVFIMHCELCILTLTQLIYT